MAHLCRVAPLRGEYCSRMRQVAQLSSSGNLRTTQALRVTKATPPYILPLCGVASCLVGTLHARSALQTQRRRRYVGQQTRGLAANQQSRAPSPACLASTPPGGPEES